MNILGQHLLSYGCLQEFKDYTSCISLHVMFCSIDSTHSEGLGRICNDDNIKPNAVMKKIESKEVNLCIFALRNITLGDEIRYDYGPDDGSMWWRYQQHQPHCEDRSIEEMSQRHHQSPCDERSTEYHQSPHEERSLSEYREDRIAVETRPWREVIIT